MYELGGKALFIKELELALQKKEIDFAVHSMKDLPGIIDNDFTFPVVFEREDPFDALISNFKLGGFTFE